MPAVLEYDPTRPSGEGRIPRAVRTRRREPAQDVSETSRALILAEAGIDPASAEEEYWYSREAEANRAARRRAAEEAAAQGELARRQDEFRRRIAEREAQREAERVAALEVPDELEPGDVARALVFAVFLLIGLAGFLGIFGPPAWVRWGVAALLSASTSGYLLYDRQEIPLPGGPLKA